MTPNQRTKLAADIYTIFAGWFADVSDIVYDEQAYTALLEEIEAYIAEKIG